MCDDGGLPGHSHNKTTSMKIVPNARTVAGTPASNIFFYRLLLLRSVAIDIRFDLVVLVAWIERAAASAAEKVEVA